MKSKTIASSQIQLSRFMMLAILALAGLVFCLAPLANAATKTDLKVGVVLEPTHLDPTAGAAASIDEVVYQNIFQGLTRIDRNGAVQPSLASQWVVSKDGLTYDFTLQAKVKFHDGSDFSADDVVFSFKRAMADDSVNAQKVLFEPIDQITAIDPLHVQIKLKRISPDFLFSLAWGDAVIISPKSADGNKTNPIGTGPFIFQNWKKGDSITLIANPNFWGKRTSNLQKITFQVIADPAAAFAAITSHQIDLMPNFPAPEMVANLKQSPDLKVVIGNTEGETILALNNANPILSNPLVRRALTYAIDKKSVMDGAMSGFGTAIGSHFSPLHPAYVDLSQKYPYNIAKAKELLQQAGIKEPIHLSLKLPPPPYARRSGEIIATELAQIDVLVDIVPVEWGVWIAEVFKEKKYDMTIISHTEPLDIGIYARDDYYFNYANGEFKTIYDQIKLTRDEQARNRLYQQAQAKLADDHANVFLFQLPKIGVWDAKLQGVWENSPIQANDLSEVNWQP